MENKIEYKICTSCNAELEVEKFSFLNSKQGTRNSRCKSCRNKESKEKQNERKQSGTKLCLECNEKLDVSLFSANKAVSDGLQSYCKTCKFKQMQIHMSNFDNFINKLYLDLKHNAAKRAKKLNVAITKEDIKELYSKQDGKCVFTGKKMTTQAYVTQGKETQHIINKWNISIDRIDSSKGYTKDNIQLVCAIVNRMKTDLTDEEFVQLCRDINEFYSSK